MIVKESPLKGMSTGSAATVIIRELTGLHTIDLRVAPGSPAQAAVTKALGVDLPGKTGQSTTWSASNGKEAQALCLAPDWWLIVAYEQVLHQLTTLKDAHHFSIVDVSGQRTTIDLEGPNAKDVLAHIWEQDLRDKNFPVGSVSQGLIVKAPVIVYHAAPLRYRIMVRSSFAVHVWKAVTDAAVEWM